MIANRVDAFIRAVSWHADVAIRLAAARALDEADTAAAPAAAAMARALADPDPQFVVQSPAPLVD